MMLAEKFFTLHPWFVQINRRRFVEPGRRVFRRVVLHGIGRGAAKNNKTTGWCAERLCEGLHLFERRGGKAPDHIGSRGNILPGRLTCEIELDPIGEAGIGQMFSGIATAREDLLPLHLGRCIEMPAGVPSA